MLTDFDLAAYANRTFSMYGGQAAEVRLVFQNSMAGVVMDRFGKETRMRPVDDGHFAVRVQVALSGQFFGWLSGLGSSVRIAGPDKVAAAYRAHLEKILAEYTDKEGEKERHGDD